jgi:hypothetical protein
MGVYHGFYDRSLAGSDTWIIYVIERDPEREGFEIRGSLNPRADLVNHSPSGPGVDALRIDNLDRVGSGFGPQAVVIDGQWHECGVFAIEPIARRMGLNVPADQLEAERKAVSQWQDTLDCRTDRVPRDHWVAVVDCHH